MSLSDEHSNQDPLSKSDLLLAQILVRLDDSVKFQKELLKCQQAQLLHDKVIATRYMIFRKVYRLLVMMIVLMVLFFSWNYYHRNPEVFTLQYGKAFYVDLKQKVDNFYISTEDSFNTQYLETLTVEETYYDDDSGDTYVSPPVQDSYSHRPSKYPLVTDNLLTISRLKLKPKQLKVARVMEDELIRLKATPYEFSIVMALGWHESKFRNIGEHQGSRAKSKRNSGGGYGKGVMQWTHLPTQLHHGVTDPYNIPMAVRGALGLVRVLRSNHRKHNRITASPFMTSAIFADYNGGQNTGLRLLKKGNAGVVKHNRQCMFAYRVITQ